MFPVLLTALHVLTAILFLGPVTVATSTFHVKAFAAHQGDEAAKGAASTLYRITQTYGILSLLVPLLGFALMFTGNYWTDGKFHVSIALSVIAWALLLFVITPRQTRMMNALRLLPEDELTPEATITDWNKAKGQLSMFGGIFALLWVIIAILMMI